MLLEAVAEVERLRAGFQAAVADGYRAALTRLPLRPGPAECRGLAPGMLDALVAAALVRPAAWPALKVHYCDGMPAMLAAQLRRAGGDEERLFSTRLSLSRMPRLKAALDALWSLVSAAGVDCSAALGAATPAALISAHPTLGELYEACHFGGSMPMLYAYPGDLAALPSGALEAYIDRRFVGPLVHELAHLGFAEHVLQPTYLHEVLAAWLGSEAWPAQVWPSEPGVEDALPGGAFLAATGAWVARALGDRGLVRLQAGVDSLEDAFGPECAAALRLYGMLPFLETSAPHLLSDAFRPDRWWKLIDLHRDPALSASFAAELVAPLLRAVPEPGEPLRARWNAVLDGLSWSALPAFRDEPSEADRRIAVRAERAVRTRAVREGLSFRSVIVDAPVTVDRARCEVRAELPVDAVGAPAVHPYPPPLCRS